MSKEERLTAIIGIRVYPARKRELMEFAKRKGITFSDYISTLIELGLERVEELKSEMLNRDKDERR